MKVVDTTGAGDAFRGGFVAAWLEAGAAAEADELLRFANAVAALNCRGLGAQAGLPGTDEVRRLLASTVLTRRATLAYRNASSPW